MNHHDFLFSKMFDELYDLHVEQIFGVFKLKFFQLIADPILLSIQV